MAFQLKGSRSLPNGPVILSESRRFAGRGQTVKAAGVGHRRSQAGREGKTEPRLKGPVEAKKRPPRGIICQAHRRLLVTEKQG